MERTEAQERIHRQHCYLVSVLIAERGTHVCTICRRAWAVDVHRDWHDGGLLAVGCGCGVESVVVGQPELCVA